MQQFLHLHKPALAQDWMHSPGRVILCNSCVNSWGAQIMAQPPICSESLDSGRKSELNRKLGNFVQTLQLGRG